MASAPAAPGAASAATDRAARVTKGTGASAPVPVPGPGETVAAVTRVVRAMFPHERFPDGPYERSARTIVDAAREDVRFRTQLEQGLRDLDGLAQARGAATFGDLAQADQLEVLRGLAATEVFEGIRSRVITSLYDDREVWQLLGYEGPSYDQGGYVGRGFDDLAWLPTPRVTEWDGEREAR